MRKTAVFLLLCLLFPLITRAEQGTPVTCRFSFDEPDAIQNLLSRDWIEQTGLKTVEDRKWSLVPGRFGSGLSLGAVPLKYDVDNMSGLDLDMVTAVIFNVGYIGSKGRGFDEPFIWGAGNLHPALGAVSFWVKGSSKPASADARTILFEQTTTTWGRKERQLIEIELYRDRSISAYVEDARYVQHTVTSGPVWDDSGWNHVVFMWDRSSGVSLWVNGTKAASTLGDDAWWENQRPGLFHLPMSQAVYDEFYLFDRMLSAQEIENLYRKNIPPVSSPGQYSLPAGGAKRLKEAFIADSSKLPVVRPMSEDNALVFTEITPERIHDGGITGWWICDGRYELAWPHEYSVFTIIPGDVDFHAGKADILPPRGADINFVTLEGNLDDVSVLQGDRNGQFQSIPVVSTGRTQSFFFGAETGHLGDSELRIPFTKEYGTPPGFKSDGDILRLPLSGDLRLHEAGLFNVAEKSCPARPGDLTFHLDPGGIKLDDTRYPAALHALLCARDRTALGLVKDRTFSADVVTLEPMTVLNLISEPADRTTACGMLMLDLPVISPADGNVLAVRLLDPAVPSHTWTHVEVRLDGFSTGRPGTMRLALAFDPLVLTSGDRIWLQVVATDGLTLGSGDASVTLRIDSSIENAEQAFTMKTMRPCVMGYGRSFEYIPWQWDKRMPDIDAPVNFGGQFDMAYPWQAVLKLYPESEIANIYKAYTNLFDPSLPAPNNLAYRYGRIPLDIDGIPDKQYDAPENAPDWAVYFREFQSWRGRIIDWWRKHQRPDGQAGGGWNDDTLVFSRSYGDMMLDSNGDALALYNSVFDGFEKTNYFKGGYCRIYPIDRLHSGDFVRERYKSLVYNLGDPRSAVWAMEEAWHWGKPDETPVNYGDGRGFLFGKDVMEWYWGRKAGEPPYELKDRTRLTGELRKAANACTDTTFWRFTEAWTHTDDQNQYGNDKLYNLILGGWGFNPKRDDSVITITLGVGWIEGGGPDLGRMVEYSGDDGLKISMYSFTESEQPATARLYRLLDGTYSVTLSADTDNDGSYETTLARNERELRRFGRLAFTVPPRVPVLLDIRQVRKAPDPGGLPDLAVSSHFVKRDGNSVGVTIYNIGCADSGPFSVSVVNENGTELQSQTVASIPGSGDFVPKSAAVLFSNLPKGGGYRVVCDPEDTVREIFEENNEAGL